ncbi:MAG: penicillin-binding transpeptidase domain-containing protein [Chloroflexota bacterium]
MMHVRKGSSSKCGLFLLFLLLTACGRLGAPAVQDTYDLATPAPPATDTPRPTDTPIPGGAEGVGLAFYRAWEAWDFLGMYSLLSPQSQALVDSRSFVTRYQEAMETAAVQTIHAQPLSARQDGARAEMGVRVTWETAVVGSLAREHTLELVYDQDRWGVLWREGLILPELEGGNRLLLAYRIPARANVYDRNGRALAYQGTAFTLGVIPGQITDEAGLLEVISPLLDKTPEEVKELYAAALPDWYVPLGDVADEVMQEHYAELQPYLAAGLTSRERLTRLYPENGVAPHIVGYTGFIPAEQLAEYKASGYRGDEKVGLAGVEAWGENYLAGGRGGTLTVVSPTGETVATLAETEPQQARSLYLSFDRDFQAAVEQALREAIETHPNGAAGAVVVLDVNTGAVRAMASYPTYNPAIFDAIRPNAELELAAVLNHPGQPLVNRAAQGEYPAGSLFKIVTASAGLVSGVYTPDTGYNCTGVWTGLGEAYQKFDWLAGGHGFVNLRQALTRSCNPYFYEAGFRLDGVDPFILPNTARQFGLGAPTAIVGLDDASGLIPDPDWKLANVGEGWATGDAVNMAIGQGYVLVTPLQIARELAAVANGGALLRPTVIDRIGAAGEAPEEPWPAETVGRLPLSAEQLAAIQESLRAVTNSSAGTATHRFQNFPVPVAGKTGTAEAPPGLSHAWFAGYAPAAPYTRADGTTIETPEIAIAVIVEHAGEGSAVAAPIFRRIVELYYGITPLAPYPWP